MTLGATGLAIAEELRSAFAPIALEVIDESHHHAGHAGARAQGESHFRVRIVSNLFHGVTRVERHRMVNAALKPAFESGVHALAIEARSPVDGLTVAALSASDPRIPLLLAAGDLPSADITEGDKHFTGIMRGESLLACAALEFAGSDATLRYLAVSKDVRSRGLGAFLVQKLLDEARVAGMRRIYLLTFSARDYFPRFGFVAVGHEIVPPGIAALSQFARGPCSRAPVMMKTLG